MSHLNLAMVTASKPPKGGSVSPVPPPTQFANDIKSSVKFSSQQQKSQQQISQQQTQKSSSTQRAGAVKVLPVMLQDPLKKTQQLSQQSQQMTQQSQQLSQQSQQMTQHSQQMTQQSQHISQQSQQMSHQSQKLSQNTQQSQQTQQYDQHIQQFDQVEPRRNARKIDQVDHADQYIEQLMKEAETDPKLRELTYGGQPAAKSVHSRSKSADGRLKNATGTLLNEVVTDNDHHSVRDLINMMENNIKSESLNPYVRKWGCDLISPEPHKKNVTYRREKKQIVDENELNNFKTFTWQQDDHFQKKAQISNYHNSQHSPSGRDHDLEQHTTELDDLLGRNLEVVVWPPPSPIQAEPQPPSPVFSPSPPPPMTAVPLPPSTPSPVPMGRVDVPVGRLEVPMERQEVVF